MALTRRSVWPRLRSLTLASALVGLLAIPVLAPAAGAQAEVDVEIGVSDERVEVSANGTVRDFDMGVVVEGGPGFRLSGLRSAALEGEGGFEGGVVVFDVSPSGRTPKVVPAQLLANDSDAESPG